MSDFKHSANVLIVCRLHLKCDGTRAETRFRLSAKRTSPLNGYTMFRGSVKSTGYPLHSPVSPSLPHLASPCAITFQLDSTAVVILDTACSEVVWRVLATTSFASFPFTSLPCVTVCHHISTGLYVQCFMYLLIFPTINNTQCTASRCLTSTVGRLFDTICRVENGTHWRWLLRASKCVGHQTAWLGAWKIMYWVLLKWRHKYIKVWNNEIYWLWT
jgi:hypothetical protein